MNTIGETTAQMQSAQVQYVRPVYRVREDKNSFFIDIELPGIKRECVSIALNKGQLNVVAKRTHQVPENWKKLRKESANHDYKLGLALNVEVNESKIAANLADGILTLELPKAEEVKPRRIDIN